MFKKISLTQVNKVLAFEQSGQYYHKKAQKYIYNNNYIDALSFYRKAVDKEPENVNYRMDLAQAFNEMNYYDESNRMLFLVLQKEKNKADCYFGLGCNFLALREYDKAEECFDRYMKLDSEGLYSEDADDLLDLLRNTDYYAEDEYHEGYISTAKSKLFKLANKGRVLLDVGDYNKAIKCMEKVAKSDPTLVFVRNNLSLAYFCIGQTDKAIKTTYEILDEYPDNVHANCNLAIMLHDIGDESKVSELSKVILEFKANDHEELHKIAVTLCELKLHKEANQALKKLLQFRPYDVKVLHYYAVSFFNMQYLKNALHLWEKVEKLMPDNMISDFYKRITRSYLKSGREFKEMGYHFQVPYEEIIYRLRRINEMLSLNPDDFKHKWERNNWIKGLFEWGLTLNETGIKKSILKAVASAEDERAEYFLRDLCLQRNVEYEVKSSALMFLNQMGAKEPFLAYIEDHVVEVSISTLSSIKKDINSRLPGIIDKIAIIAINTMKNRYEHGFESEIEKIWSNYVYTVQPDSLTKIKEVNAWAAAIELYYCIFKGLKINKSRIISYYDAKYSTALRNYNKLQMVLSH